jgi:hypothetical protein
MYVNGIEYMKDKYNWFDLIGEILYLIYALKFLEDPEKAHSDQYYEYCHIVALFCIYILTIG